MQDHSYEGPDVVRFVPLLAHEIPGQLLVMWDGASLHRCQAVKDSVRKGGAKRIHLEQLPASAPELNPQEGVWNLLKRVERTNVCCLDGEHIQREVRRAKERLRHRTSALRQCFAHAGYSLSFSWFRSIVGSMGNDDNWQTGAGAGFGAPVLPWIGTRNTRPVRKETPVSSGNF